MGLATAETFIVNGAKVVIADIQTEVGRAACGRLGDHARFRTVDVTDDRQVAALVAYTVDEFGSLDVLFSNAGAAGELSPVTEITPEGLNDTLALNLCAHVSTPNMRPGSSAPKAPPARSSPRPASRLCNLLGTAQHIRWPRPPFSPSSGKLHSKTRAPGRARTRSSPVA
jgi:NAD(P)-dependent dehydrogenase (short-subunit alcohol dehydrogenase family)